MNRSNIEAYTSLSQAILASVSVATCDGRHTIFARPLQRLAPELQAVPFLSGLPWLLALGAAWAVVDRKLRRSRAE